MGIKGLYHNITEEIGRNVKVKSFMLKGKGHIQKREALGRQWDEGEKKKEPTFDWSIPIACFFHECRSGSNPSHAPFLNGLDDFGVSENGALRVRMSHDGGRR